MKKKIAALFIICMIIALPVYSASVFAGINNVGIFGNDEVEGYRKESDLTYVQADVAISGNESVTPEQIFFNDIAFNTCRLSEDNYSQCFLGISKNILEPKRHSFIIRLKNDSGNTIDIYASTFVVDGKAPTIESFSINPKITKKGDLTVKYSVKDYAYDTTYGLGLSRIIICKNNIATIVKEIEINDSSIDSREFDFKTSEFVSETGSANVCIAAYDKLNQVSEFRCEKLTVDETKPNIDKNSFKIIDSYGNDINYIFSKPLKSIISIEVEDDSLDNVMADLSELNKDEPSYKRKIASCVNKGGVSLCTWSNILIKINKSGKINIKIEATDAVGNTAEESVSYDFKVDTISPIVKSIKSSGEVEYDGIKYIKKGSDIIAEIQEKESGLNLKKFWMKVSGKEIRANSCTKSGEVWNCFWNNLIFNEAQGSSIRVFILPNSEDDAGNDVDLDKSVLSETFAVDSKNPILVGEIEITNLNNRTYVQDEIVSGDILHIKAVLTDKTPVTASADLLSLGLGKDEKATCTQNGTKWICEWTTSEIAPKSINNILKFKFTDLVGNEAKKNLNIKILGISVEENPNYWEISNIEKMPLAIDRQTTELINHQTYYHIKLKPIDVYDNPIILALDLQCSGDMDYINDYKLINEKFNDPYMVLTLKQESMPNVSLSFNCSLLIISRVGDIIIQNTEEEPVDVTIDFYNMPLGELSQSVKDKIENAQDSWLVEQEWIGQLEKWISIAEKICGLLGTWGEVNKALADIEGMATIFGWGFAETISDFVKKSDDMHQKFMDSQYNLCKYISCEKGLWGDWYNNIIGKQSKPLGDSGFVAEFWPQNPKDSLVLSLATGCLPGIVHNLQKRRQIECYYILCLKNAAVEGISLSVCEEQKAYLECMFIYGEIFQIIPFAGFFKGLTEHVETIFADPIGMIFAGINFYCDMQPAGALHAGCILGHLVPTLASIAEDIVGFVDADSWSLSGDVCEEALKPMPETTEEDTNDDEDTDESTQDENQGEDESENE